MSYRSPTRLEVVRDASSIDQILDKDVNKWEKFIEIIQECLILCNPTVNNIIVAGDFNVNFLVKTNHSSELCDIFF